MSIAMTPDWPNGASPAQGPGGSAAYKTRTFTVLGAYNTLIPAHSWVFLDQSDAGGVEVYVSGAVTELIGVAVHSTPASTSNQNISVYTLENRYWEMQLDTATTSEDELDEILGLSTTIVGNNSANSLTGRSIGELDASGLATAPTTEKFATIVNIARGVDNRIATDSTERTRVQFIVNAASQLGNTV